ncbi:MAG: hypothetical protein DWQ41_01135 [Planctomycetota bacterium]|nr:MAG: hypothetical protein DWQ41_01135 [Planctomycetota bacterium]
MTPYSVVWHADAHDLLAEIWLQARDRSDVSDSANAIDELLRFEPTLQGRVYDEQTRCLTMPPLQVYFDVLERDRLVRIAHVRRINFDSAGGNGSRKN